MTLDMGHMLMVLLVLLWSSGLQAEESHNDIKPLRLEGGSSRCTGTLEMNHEGEWRPVYGSEWTITEATVICRELDCGSVVSIVEKPLSNRYRWGISSECVRSESPLMDCVKPNVSSNVLEITCSDSVRLVNGTSLCSGRLEVKSNQQWSSVCEDDFDQQDAEVVCRELGCGAPSVLQGALYGEVEAPMWTKEFQCRGHESALQDCRSSDSVRNTCSPDKAVGLTCSEPVRLVGGSSRCSGTLEVNMGEWRPVSDSGWTLKDASVFCRELDCGSAVSTTIINNRSLMKAWAMTSECVQSGSVLMNCVRPPFPPTQFTLGLTCLDSVRLVNGTNSCSGRLEVKSNQQWSSVCEDDFDLQDAEVVCRELGCGAPSVLQGALYGEVEAPLWSKEFQCEGNESLLLDCRSSDSARSTCSPGKAVGLTCSAPVRLVGGSSRCSGTLEIKHRDWRPVDASDWMYKEASVICRELECGSVLSVELGEMSSTTPVWKISPDSVYFGSALRDCVKDKDAYCCPDDPIFLQLTCSDSVRLVNGASLRSGRLEVKSNQQWSSVCEDDFDQQDAEVVCRELGYGAPSVLQGGLYGDVEAPMWTKEFQCGGNESALLDCRRSDSARNTCSPGKAVGLTCSEPVRLVGGSSRCSGTLEVKQGEWRPVVSYDWNLQYTAVFCRMLDCGSIISVSQIEESSDRPMWDIKSGCVESASTLRGCLTPVSHSDILQLTCSDSVRLVNGTSLCSGRLELNSDQQWSSVCEDDFDQQDAEVVCRELGCGAPSVLQGGLYGEVEAPMWTKEFQCGGHESALLDCRSSDSARNTCSPGKAVGLTCSEPVRLVGGSSRCSGTLEMKHLEEWRTVYSYFWTPQEAAVACRDVGCGSAVSMEVREFSEIPVWSITSDCTKTGSTVRECVRPYPPYSFRISGLSLGLSCTDSVRLVNGTSLCSGRLEVKSNQQWSSVCEHDFDQQDAEVVCRELGCGAPSVLQGALYGEVEAPLWTKEFQCEGNESALLDCRSSDSARNTCSPGKPVGLTCSEPPFRLVGNSSDCIGMLEVKHEVEWRPVSSSDWSLKDAVVVCRKLDCGPAVSIAMKWGSSYRTLWSISSECFHSGSAWGDCIKSDTDSTYVEITCSDSVRLVNGTSSCSGRLEVKSYQSNQQWSSVCETDFDQQDAEVVCRELGCGAPSVLQGALYGEAEAPMWTEEFQCGGNESALLDCRSSDSVRNTCSPGKAVGLTCSEPVRLVEGDSNCTGVLELKDKFEWRPVAWTGWTLKEVAVACRELGCGSVVSLDVMRYESSRYPLWEIKPDCVQSASALRECLKPSDAVYFLWINCSDSVRLVNGTNSCSGRLEVKSNQQWSSVCEDDFDQQDAEVVCRELGCGAPSVPQGALYGEVEAPVWTKEFQCGGNESALLDCRSSDSARNTCSPGKTVGLTCSDPVRLVGGSSRCSGRLEVNRGGWRQVSESDWTLKDAAAFCRILDCGSAIYTSRPRTIDVKWRLNYGCVLSGYGLRDCVRELITPSGVGLSCSNFVRLVNGGVCSGRLEVKSNQQWSSVCEHDFDLQDAEVVCRELGCGAPSFLQGALYGEAEAPMWTKEFQCEGNESALQKCRRSDSARSTCSPGKAVGLTCSEPLRLARGSSRCSGTLELRHQTEWRRVFDKYWTLKEATPLCRKLNCGSAVSVQLLPTAYFNRRPVWAVSSDCVHSASGLRGCARSEYSHYYVDIVCSDMLFQPFISLSFMDGVSQPQQQGSQVITGSNFNISCSIQPQFPGGSFLLTFTSFSSARNYTQPAVNHSAHFLFPAAEPAHQGNYSCFYHVHVFSHDFSSESRLLSLTVSDSQQ